MGGVRKGDSCGEKMKVGAGGAVGGGGGGGGGGTVCWGGVNGLIPGSCGCVYGGGGWGLMSVDLGVQMTLSSEVSEEVELDGAVSLHICLMWSGG